MRTVNLILLLCLLYSCKKENTTSNCFVNKGIKTATVYSKEKDFNSFSSNSEEDFVKTSYDTLGRILDITGTNLSQEIFYHYKEGKLSFILLGRNLPQFYNLEDLGSLLSNPIVSIDTVKVIKLDSLGRIIETLTHDGMREVNSYSGCNYKKIVSYSSKGKIIRELEVIKKDGNLVESVNTLFNPTKSTRTSTYFDYVFDEHGHWIKRSYQHQGKRAVVESRELTHY